MQKGLMSAGIVMAAALYVMTPQRVLAGVPEAQMDGVMGQSVEDETAYDKDLESLILKGAGTYTMPAMLRATSSTYTPAFLEESFTTDGDYTNATYYHKGEYEDYTLLNGIDVSWWQGVGGKNSTKTALDWEKIHDAGIDFAFVRVASRDNAQGTLYEDTCADSHIQEALDNDINIGLYIFSQALTEEEAEEEAEYVLDLIDQYDWDVTMPIVIDREKGSYNRLTAGKLSKSKETAVCQAFADTITDAGYDASVYASYAWIKSYIDTDSLDDCGIWIARYNNTTTSNSKSGTPYADVPYDYDFWQYSSVAKVSGYSGNLDVDYWYKDTGIKTTGLKVTANTANSISLSWSAAGDAPKYRVYRYDEGQGKYVHIGTTSKKSYTDSGLSAGKTYQYKVRGYWTIGGTNYFGGYSSAVEMTTLPGKAGGLMADEQTSSKIVLSWNQVSGASGYRIYQYDKESDSYVKLKDITDGATTCEVSGLSSATEYRFKVRAFRKLLSTNYWGSTSSEFATVTDPSKTGGVTLTTKSSTSIELSWNKVSRASGYRIYRFNTDSGKYERIATIKGNTTFSYTDSGLSTGKEYQYKIRAYKAYNGTNYYGSYSDIKTAITKPGKVGGLKLKTKSSTVTLTWNKVARATGYQVYRLNTKTGKYEKVATVKGSTTLTYTDKKLKKGTAYTYKVRAYKSYEGEQYYGSYSSTAKITAK
ncbi:MAG: fibronectin type III domain-containing protein [Lachnospiraceae bacterium]|nr:fibronectin type III domain-containing protein [Lachnospiraceae bacterium]